MFLPGLIKNTVIYLSNHDDGNQNITLFSHNLLYFSCVIGSKESPWFSSLTNSMSQFTFVIPPHLPPAVDSNSLLISSLLI